jgi:hypothetical protein
MSLQECVVRAKWDAEAGVWYVADSNLPGLVAEADTVDALHDKVIARVRELADLNRHLIDWQAGDEIPVHLTAERLDTVRLAG